MQQRRQARHAGFAGIGLIGLIGLAACAGGSESFTYGDHCKAALGRLVGPADQVLVLDTKISRGGGGVTVALNYERNSKPKAMQCRYAGSGRTRASAITYEGTALDANTLAAVNGAVTSTDKPLERLRKRIPNPNPLGRNR